MSTPCKYITLFCIIKNKGMASREKAKRGEAIA
jgi:hypothetical protein